MIPFFVVDRPMSLKLLEFCGIDKQNSKIGLMGHANTTKNFQKLFKKFKGKNIVKMADSGVFTKNGCMSNGYEELFSKYEFMGVEYGIMIDVFKNKDETIKSARKAIRTYKKHKRSFNLVGVAQGNSIEEYFSCYTTLKNLGFEHIAIGGLLVKHVNSARYVHLKSEKFLGDVLKKIRTDYPGDWLFTLGCYNPKRHSLLEEYNVFGGDYKGWILNYKNPERIIEDTHKEMEKLDNTRSKKLKELKEKRKILAAQINGLMKNRKNKPYTLIQKINELKEKRHKIDADLVKTRIYLSKNKGSHEYLSKIRKIDKFLNIDENQKREYRFKQIRSYLNKNIYSSYKDRLIIISCSDVKTNISNPAPALELYDGPVYKSIRKLINEDNFPDNVDILIISAKYGLLGMYDFIEHYNQRMTKKRLSELKPIVYNELEKYFKGKKYNKIFINLGKEYLLILDGIEDIAPKGAVIVYAQGRIGQKLKQTKDWILDIRNQN